MAEIRVLFVGTNPSEKSITEVAFHESTKSGRILRQWVAKANIEKPIYGNICNKATPGNRGLKKDEIAKCAPGLWISIRRLQPSHIVALGNTASTALDACKIPHLKMPHPSGLNRKLNDPAYVEEQIKKLKEYVYGSQT